MLSIGSMGGSGAYYLQLAREDYYLSGGEPLGQWWGRGADQLVGLGTVANDDLKALIKGFAPDGKPLVQNAGQENRQQGWDLTFSAPKSVSVLWSQADPETRLKIQAAQAAAVAAALDYLQDERALTRRGKDGADVEPAGLVVATFEHGTSRALDPQLHTHALVVNLATRGDGSTGTLVSQPVYQAKMAAGALYRAELAAQLERRLGLRCERETKGDAFAVAGVPEDLCEAFSKRRAAIEDHLKAKGYTPSAAAAAVAALETRRTKEDAPSRSELFEEWRKTGESYGFDFEGAHQRERRTPDVSRDARKVIDAAVEKITASHSHFSELELLRHAAVAAQGTGLTARDIRDQVKRELGGAREILPIGIDNGEARFTTQGVIATEQKLIAAAEKLAANVRHGASTEDVERDLRKFGGRLNDEQRDAVRHLTEKGGGLRSLEGFAGTGKTSTLSVVRQVLERQGYTVVGVTLAAKAARELKEGADISSATIAKLQHVMREPSFGDVLKHEAAQVGRAFMGKDRWDTPKQTIRISRKQTPGDFLKEEAAQVVRALFGEGRLVQAKSFGFHPKVVLVIDEAAMVATKDLTQLAAAVAKGGGMLVTVFDRKQLQAIGPGGGAAYLADRHGKAELTDIVRQNEEWSRDAVRQMSRGDAAGALKQFQLAGRLHVADDRDKATAALVSDWAKNERGKREGSLIFVGTRAEVADVNTRCQAARREAGEIGKVPVKVDGQKLYTGDRLLFTKNSKKVGVVNGDLGTVLGVIPGLNIASVKLDGRDGLVNVPLSTYKDVQLGYAVTTHKGQGSTVDSSYLLAGGTMQDLHLSYVQASRARESTRIYTDSHEAGPNLSQLAKQMSREREKTLAHQVINDNAERQRQTINIRQEVEA